MVDIARIGRHTSLRGLARSLFPEPGDAASLRRAEEALLAANPGLADEAGLRPGAPVLVPGPDGGSPLQADRRDATGPEAARAEMERGLATLGKAAAEALATERKEAKAAADLLRGTTTRGALQKRYPDLVDGLPALADLMEGRSKSAAVRATATEAAIGQALKDLAALGSAGSKPD